MMKREREEAIDRRRFIEAGVAGAALLVTSASFRSLALKPQGVSK
jgi:hypothetical protein